MNPNELTESRVQLHYAIQFIAATNAVLVTPESDYSHTALQWNPDLKSFLGQPISTAKPVQVGLNPVSLTAFITEAIGQPIAALPLPGQTMATALQWHKTELAKLGIETRSIELLNYPPDDFPDHPLAHGATFDTGNATARQTLTAYYHNSYPVLQKIASRHHHAAPIRIWPHHFDMATSIPLPDRDDSAAIGVGLSPGDASYNEPYWYVTPWPYPTLGSETPLEGNGHWHSQGWIGAVLTASKLETDDIAMARQQVTLFLESTIAASADLLHR